MEQPLEESILHAILTATINAVVLPVIPEKYVSSGWRQAWKKFNILNLFAAGKTILLKRQITIKEMSNRFFETERSLRNAKLGIFCAPQFARPRISKRNNPDP